MNQNLPTQSQLLSNFMSCINWEDKYMYIMDLGKMLPNFPKNLKTQKYLISGCQSYTWIALVLNSSPMTILQKKHNSHLIKFYGDSDAAIVKGIITIIFILYKELNNIQKIINFNPKPFLLNQLKLQYNLTISRSQGIYNIIYAIQKQAKNLVQQKEL